jgi:small subunit ribosomal protein S9
MKESVASGSGIFTINEKKVEEYFPRVGDMEIIMATLSTASEDRTHLDITVIVQGGGTTGQTSAVKLGLARAIILMKPDVHAALRKGGFLSRDPRVKERKKPGLKRARKAPTYTKR